MRIIEYRIEMPLSVEEYQIAQLYSVIQCSRNETGGGDGVEVLINELFSDHPQLGNSFPDGQFTKKKYHLSNKVSGLLRTLLPKTALTLDEAAWNAYPYCRTIVSNEYMGNDFGIEIRSYHLPGPGDRENVHELPPDQLAKREVVHIDISAELIDHVDYDIEEDPSRFNSVKTGRGPLTHGWMNTIQPLMTCYKLVICHFNWFGLQKRLEHLIERYERRLFTKFHRQLFCWMDSWYGLSLDEIRSLEDEGKAELEAKLNKLKLFSNVQMEPLEDIKLQTDLWTFQTDGPTKS